VTTPSELTSDLVVPLAPTKAVREVVGIGASAGGLDAMTHLLRHLPPNTGMAYVLVQHLDPAHESHLVQLLGKVARMPVLEASDNLTVQPDHVYVIPPNARLSLHQGTLRVVPRAEERGQHTPIDFFFHSLAEDQGSRAIGVVLSGTGSDGTAGITAIKAHGGLAFAQDDTAQYGGMPRSAIDSGCVERALPPEGIAHELERISQHPPANDDPLAVVADEAAQDSGALEDLFQLLSLTTSVDYVNYKRSTVLRRIKRRQTLHQLEGMEEYVSYAQAHPEEVQALHQDLLIHVTRFFRDPEVFEALATRISSSLEEGLADVPIRIWVPGCSTGEEAYSLVIRLWEMLGDRAGSLTIKLFATDVSEPTLEHARSGKYPDRITADVSPERLRRFFVQEQGGYRINKALRDLCVFARHDMTRDPPFSNLDLISCRNVLIYLSPALQKRVLPYFHYALKPQGILALGSSEAIGALSELFTVLDPHHKIYLRKATPSQRPSGFPAMGDMPSRWRPSSAARAHEVPSTADLQREADRRVLGRYAPAGVVITPEGEILQFRGQTGSFLAPAPGSASLNVLKMAREGLLLGLRTAIDEATRTGAPSRREGLRVRANTHTLDVNVHVIPFQVSEQHCLVALFEDVSAESPRECEPHTPPVAVGEPEPESCRDGETEQLRRELAGTKAYLESIIGDLESTNDDLRVANEEILSGNEELQSTNEELQTSKEELQATNEELNTANEELQRRYRETAELTDDLENLFASVQIPIVMVGNDLCIRRFSPSAAQVFSLVPNDVNRSIADLQPKLVGVDLERQIAEVLATLVARENDVRDRQGRWHHLCVRPYRTGQDRIGGVIISVTDIDALKQSEQRIERARAYAESIIATVQIPLVVLDAELRVVSANRAFYQTFQVEPADTELGLLSELGNRQWNAAALLERLREVVDRDQAFHGFLLERTFPSIGPRRMLLSARRLVREEPEPPLVLLAFEDDTERHRLETELRQAQKMESIGHLAAGIAHDFNNLLTVIAGYTSLLEVPTPDVSVAETARGIAAATERAATLTQQLLAFSRKQRVAPEILDANLLVARTERMLHRVLGDNIRLITVVDSDLGGVFADPAVIEQVIVNLAINARDAMPGGGVLTIETCNLDLDQVFVARRPGLPAGRYVRLLVRDTGCGMDQETLAQVFEPFFTTKEVGKGTGLGLASAYGSIQQSGGYIEAESRPGQGTTFSIYLPRVAKVATVLPGNSGGEPLPCGTETILLVEDSEDVRKVTRRVLVRAGYTVLEAENGRVALEVSRCHSGPIHLLMSDIVMPEMGGPELADVLSASRPDMKVLLASGYADQSFLDQGVQSSARRLLLKPYTSQSLAQTVREVLDSDQRGGDPSP
jgi:two-component system CheB/CheR fusion protein